MVKTSSLILWFYYSTLPLPGKEKIFIEKQ